MSTLYIVRHGQASLFTDDYDRLSDLGRAQAEALAEHWWRQGIGIDAAWSGDLRRQTDTAAIVAAYYRSQGGEFPRIERRADFNEYPAEEILTSLGGYLRERDRDVARLAAAFEGAAGHADRYRRFHRLMEAIIARWVAADYGDFEPAVTWQTWSGGAREALAEVVNGGSGRSVAVFTSGGIVGLSVQTALGAPHGTAADLSWRVLNASVTRYTFSGGRVSLDRFNDVAHLDVKQLTYR